MQDLNDLYFDATEKQAAPRGPAVFVGALGAGSRTTLWAESTAGAGDYHPLEVEPGQIAVFHGSLCRHHVPANPTRCTRASLDFRVGVEGCFDPRRGVPRPASNIWFPRGPAHTPASTAAFCRAGTTELMLRSVCAKKNLDYDEFIAKLKKGGQWRVEVY